MNSSRFQSFPTTRLQYLLGRYTPKTKIPRDHITQEGPPKTKVIEYVELFNSSQRPIDVLMSVLNDLMYNMRSRKATDHRDFLYVLYGIVTRICQQMVSANPLAAPDYHASVTEA